MTDTLLPPMAPRPSWRRLLIVDIVITFVVLLTFGVCGGFTLLLALNGFSERGATPLIIGYILIIIAGNLLATITANRFLLRKHPRVMNNMRQTAWLPAVVATISLLLLGPLAFVFIRLLYSG
jgi:hypothetical protein